MRIIEADGVSASHSRHEGCRDLIINDNADRCGGT